MSSRKVAPSVEADGQVFRRLVGEDQFEQRAREAVGGVGRLAALGGERFERQGVEHAVGQRVAVNQDEFFRSQSILNA
jgi:hypothetical protein